MGGRRTIEERDGFAHRGCRTALVSRASGDARQECPMSRSLGEQAAGIGQLAEVLGIGVDLLTGGVGCRGVGRRRRSTSPRRKRRSRWRGTASAHRRRARHAGRRRHPRRSPRRRHRWRSPLSSRRRPNRQVAGHRARRGSGWRGCPRPAQRRTRGPSPTWRGSRDRRARSLRSIAGQPDLRRGRHRSSPPTAPRTSPTTARPRDRSCRTRADAYRSRTPSRR